MDTKYLGITLSNDLEWSKHIATITNKDNFKLSFLRHNLKDCPEKIKKTAYFSLIRSFMEYPSKQFGNVILPKRNPSNVFFWN